MNSCVLTFTHYYFCNIGGKGIEYRKTEIFIKIIILANIIKQFLCVLRGVLMNEK